MTDSTNTSNTTFDNAKRKTLKVLAASAGTLAAGGVTYAATSLIPSLTPSIAPAVSLPDTTIETPELANIEVSTRLSIVNNDIEVVLTNAGNKPVTITQMTPSYTQVARGEFDFSELLEDGPLTIDAGKSVSVPIQHRSVMTAVSSHHQTGTGYSGASPLTDSLKKSMSIITEGESFARVTIA